MIQQVEILGAHAWFFRDGAAYTVPGAGNASRTAKPGATDAAWLDLGIVDIGLSPKSDEKEIWRPAPAVKELEDVIPYKRQLDVKIKKQELNNLDFELIFASLALPLSGAGGQFNPLELQAASVKGWLKIQYYGRQSARDGSAALLTADLYVMLKYDGDFEPGEEPVEPQLVARVLRSPLNTGNLV
jgi:hypothetical protein